MEIKDVVFSYPNGRTIINNLNLKVEKSKILGIIGPNGSGKTTLLDIMANLIKPTKGEIINNESIGYLFQNTKSSFFCNTVKEEIEMSALTHNYKIKQLQKRVKDVLKIVNLDESILSKNPMLLSNNETKLVALASILIYNPKIIILDEPTNNLDDKTKNELLILFKMLKNKYNKTIIIVSHDMEFIHKIVDNVVVLNNGEIVLYGTKYQVFNNTRVLKRYGLLAPKIMLFRERVLNRKGIRLEYRDEINDLIKDIFRNVY